MINYFFLQDTPRLTYKQEKLLGFLTVLHLIAVPRLPDKHKKQQAPRTTAPYAYVYCNTKGKQQVKDYRVTSLVWFWFVCLFRGIFLFVFLGGYGGVFLREKTFTQDG